MRYESHGFNESALAESISTSVLQNPKPGVFALVASLYAPNAINGLLLTGTFVSTLTRAYR